MTKIYTLSNGTIVIVKATNKREACTKMFKNRHFVYTITFKVGDKKFSTTFHDSNYNYCRNICATEKMIDDAVNCIICDARCYSNYTNFYDFCSAFGYEIHGGEGYKVWNACAKTCEKLEDMFSSEEINELYEMTETE